MHAASQIGKRAGSLAAFVLLFALAGCGTTGSDNPALTIPQLPPGSAAPGLSHGPAVTYFGDIPQVAGQSVVNTALQRLAPRGCRVATLRDDASLVSFRWVCSGNTLATATFSLVEGRQLDLADLLGGGYQTYLSSTAMAQLQAEGAANPTTSNLSAWALTPDSLQVTFPAGTVSFPLASLKPYLRRPGPLSP